MMSTHPVSDVGSDPDVDDARELRAELRVRPRDPAGCALAGTDGDGDVIAHDVVCEIGTTGCKRECRAAVERDGSVRMMEDQVDDGCVCPVFQEHDCVSSIETVENGELVIEISLRSRSVLTSIVEKLRSRGASVELRSITREGSTPSGRPIRIDANSVTDKQREAIAAAIEMGYYDTPRESDLSDLADRLGVSRSAVSQRLTAAESTLVEALYDVEAEIGRNREQEE